MARACVRLFSGFIPSVLGVVDPCFFPTCDAWFRTDIMTVHHLVVVFFTMDSSLIYLLTLAPVKLVRTASEVIGELPSKTGAM